MRIFWSKPRELLEFIPKKFKEKYWVLAVKRRPWLKNAFFSIVFLTLLMFLGAGIGYYYMYYYTGPDWYTGGLVDDKGRPLDLTKPDRSEFKRATYIYDRTGETTGILFDEIRDPVRLDEVPELLQKAFIAAEDRRFYEHSGIDTLAIGSALIGNTLRLYGIKIWKRSGGASTITQQYDRLYYADDVSDFKNRARTFKRKIKEAKLAIQLEKRYPKEKILEGFLNLIWLGHGVHGVAEADRRYFGKDIRKDELPTIREAVILASINKSSVLYCPIFHKPAEPKIDKNTDPETATKLKEEYEKERDKEVVRLALAKDRYNWVLEQMKDNGDITQKEYEDNLFRKDESPNTELARLRPLKNPTYGYSNRMVKEFLLSKGYDDQDLTHYSGLRIYTTIDSKIQQIASEEFEKHLAFINKEKKAEDRLNGAFVVINVKTGDILALSGGNNFDETQYNRVFAPRSPGSAAKVFTFAGALEYHGKDLFDKVCNCPFSMKGGRPGQRWSPRNFEEKNPVPTGYIDLATAWIRSVNLAALNEAREIGMPDVIKSAHAMGVWGNPGIVRDPDGTIWFKRPGYEINKGLEPTLPTAIGASETNLIEMANAFMTFFRNGEYITPILVKEIKSTYGDEVIYKHQPYPVKRVFSGETSDKMVAMMRAVTKIGTAKISMRGIEQEVACKTGTSNGPRDLSIYCGSPEIFLAIWFGNDNYDIVELPVYMKKMTGDADMNVSGGWVTGPLARKMMDRFYASRPKVAFSENVEIQHQRILDRNPN